MSLRSPAHVARARLADRVAAAVITAGGALILLAVLLLVIFLVKECLPLLRGGTARPDRPLALPASSLAVAEDDYREGAIAIGADGILRRVTPVGQVAELPLGGAVPPLAQARISADGRLIAALDGAGTLRVWTLRLRTRWSGETRVLEPGLRAAFALPGAAGRAILAVAGEDERVSVLLAASVGGVLVRDGELVAELDLGGPATVGAVAAGGAEAWLARDGRLAWFDLRTLTAAGPVSPRASTGLPGPSRAATLLLGDVTLLLGGEDGVVSAWQVVEVPSSGARRLERSAEFPGRGAVLTLCPSQRDKSFAVVRAGSVELDHLTTRRTLLSLPDVPPEIELAALSPRRDGFLAVSGDGRAYRWRLAVPHSEASLATLFSAVRYEGYSESAYVWQSTGMTAAFEPKLSLVPLIVGTLKGALYALLFSAPCALLAALYVAQFAPPRLRLLSKPVVELMAALPSVVVGFLAALLLAPFVQRHLVALVATLVALPLAVAGAGLAWDALRLSGRRRSDARAELAIVAVLLAAVTGILFAFERRLAEALFDGDFSGWLFTHAGVTYDQRNAVVVGFALGFAVIPLIFTLAEDAFSNVPPSLVSASLALGATRWQAARTVVLPAASPGIFAAVMIGLGRAVGETMIVLMATGNTPIMSLSPFDGMRTMAACIAVELPEAPFGGTLYRVLILTALLLFVFTFAINTVAVMVAARLRRRFGRLAA